MSEELVKAVSLPGILRLASRIEREEYAFYLQMARGALDNRTIEAFLALSREEDSHLQMVQAHLSAQPAGICSGEVDPLLDGILGAVMAAEESLPWSVRCQSGAERDLRAIRQALNLENRSYEAYRRAGAKSEDISSRRLFQFLASQESRHVDILTARYHSLSGRVVLWAS